LIGGGRTAANEVWDEAIMALMREVASAREGVSSDLAVNVVFQVSGSLLQPDFEGVRTGSFRRVDPILMVQVAIHPETSYPDGPPSDLRPVLIDCLRAALDAADEWIKRRRKTFDITPLRMVVDSLDGPVDHDADS
jgi:hypothetical protein